MNCMNRFSAMKRANRKNISRFSRFPVIGLTGVAAISLIVLASCGRKEKPRKGSAHVRGDVSHEFGVVSDLHGTASNTFGEVRTASCRKVPRKVLKGKEAKAVLDKIRASQKYALDVISKPELYCTLVKGEKMSPGTTLAHVAVQFSEKVALKALDDPNVYRLALPAKAGSHAGVTVAHVAVKASEKAALKALSDPKIYRLAQFEDADKSAGLTVAHAAAIYYEKVALKVLDDPKIYRLAQSKHAGQNAGLTVAHVAAFYHRDVAVRALDDPKVYRLAQFKEAGRMAGVTVAHLAVVPQERIVVEKALGDPKIRRLEAADGTTVEKVARSTERMLDADHHR